MEKGIYENDFGTKWDILFHRHEMERRMLNKQRHETIIRTGITRKKIFEKFIEFGMPLKQSATRQA